MNSADTQQNKRKASRGIRELYGVISEYFLSKYSRQGYIIQQKSRVFLLLLFAIGLMSVIVAVYFMIRGGIGTGVFLAPVLAGGVALTCLVLLRRGLFPVVSHTLMVMTLMAVWIAIFTDQEDMLSRLDSITYIIGLLGLAPLVVSRKKSLILVYVAVNIAVFIFFVLFTRSRFGLSTDNMIEYMVDSIIPLAFVGVTSFLVFDIYVRSLDRAQASEQEIQRQNEELTAANEELEAMYEELNATHEEMVKVNDMLAEEKELMSTTLRSMDEAVITADVKGSVILMNRMAEHLTGWNRNSARGESLDRVMPFRCEDDAGGRKSPCAMIIDGDDISIHSFDNVLLNIKGRDIYVSGSCSPVFDFSGKLSGVVMIVRDITQRKRMEDELRKASRIETLGVFAGGIAHDLNNLLTAVLGNISIARYEAGAGGVPGDALQSAEEASLKTRDLARQLLTFTKGGEPIRETASMRELLLESARFALSGSGIGCDFSIADDLWNARVDRGQIGQVIHNIVLNARQAMGNDGRIRISAVNTEGLNQQEFMASPGKYVKIGISDNGPGIPGNIIEKIFDPFFTTKKEGSGLGLAIAYSIVKKHDGHIRVESSVGRGTVFEMLLPATEESIAATDSVIAPVLSGGGKVLVVDDDRNILKVMGKMLSTLGFEVETAEDGESSVVMYRNAKSSGRGYACVIMDLTMRGGMGGDDAVRIIRQFDRDARVIVSSGYANDAIIANYREYGFDDSLQKPFRIDDLQVVLARVLK